MGRPSLYSDSLYSEICSRLASGETLSSVCEGDGMPHVSQVYRWLHSHPEFRESYRVARAVGASVLFDQILTIADEEPSRIPASGGGWRYDPVSIQRLKLRIDARRWLASSFLPRVHGLGFTTADSSVADAEASEKNAREFFELLEALEARIQQGR